MHTGFKIDISNNRFFKITSQLKLQLDGEYSNQLLIVILNKQDFVVASYIQALHDHEDLKQITCIIKVNNFIWKDYENVVFNLFLCLYWRGGGVFLTNCS